MPELALLGVGGGEVPHSPRPLELGLQPSSLPYTHKVHANQHNTCVSPHLARPQHRGECLNFAKARPPGSQRGAEIKLVGRFWRLVGWRTPKKASAEANRVMLPTKPWKVLLMACASRPIFWAAPAVHTQGSYAGSRMPVARYSRFPCGAPAEVSWG